MSRAAVLESPPASARDRFPFEAPDPVVRPLLIHEWSELALVHWRYPPAEVQRLLPPGLEVDTFDGSAWIGLVPFHCTIRPRAVPRVPWLSSFAEMNVRTYVQGPNGEPAVWFISLEAQRLGAVLIARAFYGLRYYWAKMAFARVGDVATYQSRRRWPGRRGASGSLAIQVGDEIDRADVTELEAWFTNRWRFYCSTPLGLATGFVAHDPWPLRRARLLHCDSALVAACGLDQPKGRPLVHHGGRVDVRMSRPYLVDDVTRTVGVGMDAG